MSSNKAVKTGRLSFSGRKYTFPALLLCTAFLFSVGCAEQKTVERTEGLGEGPGSGESLITDEVRYNGESLTIGVIVEDMADAFGIIMADAMTQYIESEYSGVLPVVFVNEAAYETEYQIMMIENLLAQGVDALIVQPLDIYALAPLLEMCWSYGIPVVLLCEAADSLEVPACYISGDIAQAKEAIQQYMFQKLDDSGSMLVLEGTSASEEFYTAVSDLWDESGIEFYRDINIDRWDPRASAKKTVTAYYKRSGAPDAILCENDDMALGAADGLADGSALIAGIGGGDEMLESIARGTTGATMWLDVHTVARTAVDAAVMSSLGYSVEKSYRAPYHLVTNENVELYLRAAGGPGD